MQELDAKSLEHFDGKDDKPTYIAHQGRVFDVSESRLWKGGVHMRRHHAGHDLTTDIQAAPHGPEVLERVPQVGVLKKSETSPEPPMPGQLAALLARFPMLKRHPHPMTVHFPIVFMFSVALFNVLYLITGVKGFEITAFHCLGAGLLFTPVAIGTGLFTWWLNYLSKPVRSVVIKKRLAPAMWGVALFTFILRLMFPNILDSIHLGSIIYLALVFSLSVMVTIIGWFGAIMTFPIEKD